MIRTQVRAEQAERIAGAGITGDADVCAYYRGDKHQTREMIFADRSTGQITFPYGMTPPRIERDQFSVVWVIRIAAMPDLAEAMERRDALAALVVSLLASGDLDGFEANGEKVTDTNGVEGIQVETREGETAAGGPIALAEITVPFETQTINSPNEEG